MKTVMLSKEEVRNKNWVLVDAKDQILGRLATRIAKILMGKNKASYTPHVECGDPVIVINAKDIKVTGNKVKEKKYRHYTGYPGGFREVTYERLMQKKPQDIIMHAVKGMLPHNRLARKMLTRLRVYVDGNHGQQAQQPAPIKP
jgi:large subunit ribosomal protein L13